LPDATEPNFFATPDEFRAWLEKYHDSAREVLVGYYKTGSSRPSMTWPQSVDEALCFGWIDGVRKRIDDERYMIRFTPRKPGSNWSAVNVARVKELTELGLMRPAGLNAFQERAEAKTGVYAYEQRDAAALDAAEDREFRANPQAWAFFQARPPSYRTAAIWWVVSAKKPETRRKRLATLIDDSANGRTVKPLTRPGQG
jgi:uncharacterized protein YdeI (YjbR/CyaY-like superfamily)